MALSSVCAASLKVGLGESRFPFSGFRGLLFASGVYYIVLKKKATKKSFRHHADIRRRHFYSKNGFRHHFRAKHPPKGCWLPPHPTPPPTSFPTSLLTSPSNCKSFAMKIRHQIRHQKVDIKRSTLQTPRPPVDQCGGTLAPKYRSKAKAE